MNESCVIQVPLHIHSTELRTSTFPPGSKFITTIDALKFLRHKLFSKNTSSVTSANKHGSLFPESKILLCCAYMANSWLSCTLRQFASKYGQKNNTNERIIQNYLYTVQDLLAQQDSPVSEIVFTLFSFFFFFFFSVDQVFASQRSRLRKRLCK